MNLALTLPVQQCTAVMHESFFMHDHLPQFARAALTRLRTTRRDSQLLKERAERCEDDIREKVRLHVRYN